ncbi:MAG: radical SAM protein [Myxococcales bacterium]
MRAVSRRSLMKGALAAGGAALLADPGALVRRLGLVGEAWAGTPLSKLLETAPVARFWESTASTTAACTACHSASASAIQGKKSHDHGAVLIQCGLCARACVLKEGERGACRARIHVKGQLRSLVYGRPMAIHVDPIEKKPFYHFLPGASAWSMATSGCPLRCKFCQNWELSQANPEDYDTPLRGPSQLAAEAVERSAQVVAFTYNEATVFAEYLLDVAAAAREKGLRAALISCGYMQEAPLVEMCKVLSAIKNRPQGLLAGLLQERLRRRAPAGAALHQAGGQGQGAPRDRQPGRPDPQRLGDDAARAREVPRRRGRPGRAGALHALPPRLPAAQPVAHAGGDAGAGQGDRQGGRAATRLRRQRAGTPGQQHAVPQVRKGPHRAQQLLRQRQPAREGLLPGVQRADRGRVGMREAGFRL